MTPQIVSYNGTYEGRRVQLRSLEDLQKGTIIELVEGGNPVLITSRGIGTRCGLDNFSCIRLGRTNGKTCTIQHSGFLRTDEFEVVDGKLKGDIRFTSFDTAYSEQGKYSYLLLQQAGLAQ